ncbi:MAG: tetratricopeptide repeat protein [Roseibacillus sp.]
MKFLRLIPLLSLTFALNAKAQENLDPAIERAAVEESRAESWFAEANKVYEYGKSEQTNKNFSTAARAFAACIPMFERFANTYSKHPDAPKALYRAGVANLLIGRREAAESKFISTLMMTKKRGQTAATAAFRLGALAYNDEFFKTALPHFAVTANQTDSPDLRHKALNYQARCLLLTQRIPEAKTVLKKLVDDTHKPNDFRDQARLALAHISATSGKLAEAFELYQALAGIKTTDPALLGIKAQAIVHGGMTAMRLGKSEQGFSMLNEALETIGLPDESKAEAQLMLMQHEFSAGKYDRVQELYRLGPFNAARPETTAETLLYAGRASAKLGQHNAAVEMFISVDRIVPNTRMAYEASYRKLLSFYEMRGTNIPELVNTFVELYKGSKFGKNSPWIQEARVMKAETYFSFEDYENATEAWTRVNIAKLPKPLQGPALFKTGWSLVENGDYNSAIGILSEFISRYPESPDVQAATAKRAQSYLEVGDRVSALTDCERILENKQNSPALSAFALQLSGRLYRAERQNKKMIAAYQTLLKDYDQQSQDTVARANYNMGLGYFDEGEFDTALVHLNKARNLVPEFYEDPAGTTIALCYYRLKDSDELRKTVSRLYAINPKKVLPRRLLVWLGLQMYEKSNFAAADHYLSLVVAADNPDEPDTGLWKALAKSRLELPGKETSALEAVEVILANEDDAFWRCDAFLDKANGLISLGRWDEAEISAHRGLDLDPQGTIKASLHLALGDISLARADYHAAASSYVRAAEFFLNDTSIQPLALYKAAWCLNKAGDDSAASAFEERLRMDHPDWKAPASFNIKPGSALQPNTVQTPKPQTTDSNKPAPNQKTPALPPGITPVSN